MLAFCHWLAIGDCVPELHYCSLRASPEGKHVTMRPALIVIAVILVQLGTLGSSQSSYDDETPNPSMPLRIMDVRILQCLMGLVVSQQLECKGRIALMYADYTDGR